MRVMFWFKFKINSLWMNAFEQSSWKNYEKNNSKWQKLFISQASSPKWLNIENDIRKNDIRCRDKLS